jgi:transposase InsO family protein
VTDEVRALVRAEVEVGKPPARLKQVLRWAGIAASTFFHRAVDNPKKRGRKRRALDASLVETVERFAREYPWWGYKRLAVVIRRAGIAVSNHFVRQVFRLKKLFQTRKRAAAELYQAAKLFELLPSRPNGLWQADVTYIHIPGRGWWYAVTVIDYFSRYLLALHLTASYSAPEVNVAMDLARAEAERVHGPLEQVPFLVTDNGSSFIARRFQEHIKDQFTHVRTRYRTPQQLGLLERFHQTLKREEVYWQLYDSPADARDKLAAFRERYNTVRPHWALRPVEGGDVVTPYEVYSGSQAVELPKWQGWAKAARQKLDERLHAEGIELDQLVLA